MRRREESGEAGNHETVKWTKPVSGSGFCTAAAQASSSLAEIITKGWQTCSMSINNNDCSNKIKLFWILWEPLKRSQFRSNAIPFANSCHNFSILAQLEAIQGIIQTSWQQWIVNTIVHKKQMFGDDFFCIILSHYILFAILLKESAPADRFLAYNKSKILIESYSKISYRQTRS